MKSTLKNMPKLKLSDLLRRRKMTLKQLLDEFGLTTYEGLVNRCARMGVLPPTNEEFLAISPNYFNSPQEGVVVLEAPPVIDEMSGKKIDPEAPVVPEVKVVSEVPVETAEPGYGDFSAWGTSKKSRKKKETTNE